MGIRVKNLYKIIGFNTSNCSILATLAQAYKDLKFLLHQKNYLLKRSYLHFGKMSMLLTFSQWNVRITCQMKQNVT